MVDAYLLNLWAELTWQCHRGIHYLYTLGFFERTIFKGYAYLDYYLYTWAGPPHCILYPELQLTLTTSSDLFSTRLFSNGTRWFDIVQVTEDIAILGGAAVIFLQHHNIDNLLPSGLLVAEAQDLSSLTS